MAGHPRHDGRDRPAPELERVDVIERKAITSSRRMPGARTIIVLAKQPRPGRKKTRLQSRFSPEEASELAAAASLRTLRAVRRSAALRRVLAWAGDPSGWGPGFGVAPQSD